MAATSDDRPAAYAVLDEAPLGHVGFIEAGEPVVLPANFARVDDTLYLHGSRRGALLGAIASGRSICFNAVIIDGVAVARCACHTAVNYRSVLVSGCGRAVDDPAEKQRALRAITERVTPGAWERGRSPSPADIEATGVVALPIAAISLRSRTGPPEDVEDDLGLPCWAGVVPVRLAAGPGEPAAGTPPGLPVPPVFGRA